MRATLAERRFQIRFQQGRVSDELLGPSDGIHFASLALRYATASFYTAIGGGVLPANVKLVFVASRARGIDVGIHSGALTEAAEVRICWMPYRKRAS